MVIVVTLVKWAVILRFRGGSNIFQGAIGLFDNNNNNNNKAFNPK
jgi:hypothetical protein